MAKYELLVGADPELFLKLGNKFVGAEGVIPGTKYKPYKVPKGAVQVDGMAVEFNIDPASSEDMFVDHIQSVMGTLDEMVGEHKLLCRPSIKFSKGVWTEADDNSKILGCEPDFNAYTGEANPKPEGPDRFRTAAGHIHIGWTEGEDTNDPHHILECETIVKELDFRLGYPSLLMDADKERRTLYGAAGAYRPKSYGLEYRVLSNFWLLEEKYQRWVYKVVKETLRDLAGGGVRVQELIYNPALCPQHVINKNSRYLAHVMNCYPDQIRVPV